MKTANQRLFDLQVEHFLITRRYEESTKRLLEEAGGRHKSFLRNLIKREPDNYPKLRTEVDRYVNELYATSRTSITDYLGAELDFQTGSLRKVTEGVHPVRSVNRAELERELLGSRLQLNGKKYNQLSKSFEGLSKSQYLKVSSGIRKGLVAGAGEAELVANAMKVTGITETQARTLVVTNMSHAETLIKEKVAEANKDLVSGLIFTAILDGRTSTICSSNDGLFQSINNIKVRPPLHYNCRSKLVPMLRSKDQLLANGVSPTKLDAQEPGYFTGELPSKETFSDWLRRQTTADQARHLGSEEKAALFQQGTLPVGEFFSVSGSPIGIATLRKLDNLATWASPVWQRANTSRPTLQSVNRPYKLMQSTQLRKNLEDLYVGDSMDAMQSLSLSDYKGTTLAGKRSTRHRTNNVFDERNNSFDPFTGESKSTLVYEPDFTLLQERIDYMRNSKALDVAQKEFIADFVNSMDDKVSVNQQIAITENLRIVFERYQKAKDPWDDFTRVVRSEMNYSVINSAQLLDTRSRARSELFLRFRGDPTDPSVMIGSEKVSLADLSKNKLSYERAVQSWSQTKGRSFARELYYRNKSPWRTYFFKPEKGPSDIGAKLWDSFVKRSIRSVFYKDNPVEFYSRYGKTPPKAKALLLKWAKAKVYPKWINTIKEVGGEGVKDWITRLVREEYRSIVDLEFAKNLRLPILFEKELGGALKGVEGNVVNTLSNLIQVVAEGTTTDYDSLAILLGKKLREKWPPIVPYLGTSIDDYHQEGSKILEFLRSQKIIRVNSRGVTRRSTTDIDTGRVSGNFKDTVSREVQILDPVMLELQFNKRALELSNRMGIDRDRNKYYVVPKKKNYVDARGNDTGVPVITRSANANFSEDQLDGDFADMLNHTMTFKYEVDDTFSSFMDDVARFRDPRGRSEYFDSINTFREEIIRRGDLGYGMLETVRYYRATGKPFTVIARIDGRGRVYYNG